MEIPQAKELNASAIPHKTSLGDIKTLQGFWPKILDNISNSQGTLSFTDLIKAIWLLSDSDLNIDKLRAKFFGVITTPLIVACAVLILGLTAPLSSRSSGWMRQSAVPSFVTLIIWGALTAIDKIMSASLFGLWPLVVCVIFTFWAWIVWQKN
jgi:lipopolysaccharide export LptBFGC system permease protein LptF